MAGSRGCKSFVVAVTGHTSFPGQDLCEIRKSVRRALKVIRFAANRKVREEIRARGRRGREQLLAHRCKARLWLSSCLAAGADQIASRAAFRLGYKLQVVLPGEARAYREAIRFPKDPAWQAESRAEFDALLDLAHGNITDLQMPLPPGDDDAARKIRHKAYDAATKSMLRHCDLVIAVVDILGRRDLGATGDAIRYAIRAGRPILWIDPSRPKHFRWLSHLSERDFTALCDDPLTARVVPPIIPDTVDQSRPPQAALGDDQLDRFVAQTLARKVAWTFHRKCEAFRFRREVMPAHRPRITRFLAGIWTNLIDKHIPEPLEVRTLTESRAQSNWDSIRLWFDEQLEGLRILLAMIANWRLALVKVIEGSRLQDSPQARTTSSNPPAHVPACEDERIIQSISREVDRARLRARGLAEFYAGAHRSSFLAMTALSVLAVALASVPVPADAEDLSKWFAGAELLVIFTMFGIYFCNRLLGWQEKLMNCRFLAERLRNSVPLSLAGVDPLDTSVLPIQYSNHHAHKTWVSPYFQKVMNRIDARVAAQLGADSVPANLINNGSPRASFLLACCAHIDAHWLDTQASYQRKTATRYEQLRLMFEFIQLGMLIFTIAICITHFFTHLGLLSFLASVCPAISAAAGSLALQAELVRLRDRSMSMAHAIDHRRVLLASLKSPIDPPQLKRFVEETAQEMLSEVSEWRILFKFRPINSPA